MGLAYDRKPCLFLKGFLLKNFCFKDDHRVAANYKSRKFIKLFPPMFLSFWKTHYMHKLWHLRSIFCDIFSLYHSNKCVPEDHRPSLAVLSSAFKQKKWDIVSWPRRHSQFFTKQSLYLLRVDQCVFIKICASPRCYLHTVFNLGERR